MRRYVALLALLAVSCTGGGAEPRAGDPPSHAPDGGSRTYTPRFPASLGACHGTPPPSPADAVTTLSRPGAWLRVDRVSVSEGPARREPAVIQVSGAYLLAGGDAAAVRALPRPVESLSMWNTTAQAIAEALRLGGTVTVHTGANGDPREVAYAVAVYGTEVAFVGECAYDALTVPVRERLGERWLHRYVAAMAGRPGAEVARVLAVPPERAEHELADPELRVLGRDQVPLYPRLRTVWFTVRAPASWRGGAQVCPWIELGRLECVTAHGPRTGPRVRIWYDPEDPTVEVRLYRTSPVFRRVALLATVDVARLAARADLDPARQVVLLHVDLAESPSLADILADPRRAADAVTDVRVAPCTVHRCAA